MSTSGPSGHSLPEGVRAIRLPLQDASVGHLNSYVIEGIDGHILVDCGWDRPGVFDGLVAGLLEHGLALGDLRYLVVSHWHADHYGLAERLVAHGLELLMHVAEWQHIQRHLSEPREGPFQEERWLARNGLPPTELTPAEVETLMDVYRFRVVAPRAALVDGQRLPGSRYDVRVVWTPGHTPGHMCLLDADHRLLLSGDHVLDPITPNVSIWWEDQLNPLGDFLASLRKVAALDVDLVLPAHGQPFNGLRRRIDELLAHHERREHHVVEALDGRPITATEVARAVPWTRRERSFEELATVHQQLAVSETIAHLEELRARGRVQRTDEALLITYALAPPVS